MGTPERPTTTRVGVAGWSYPDWKGIVYPAKPQSSFDPLSFLTRYFDAIEINSTFYRIPLAHTVASWARRTLSKPNFRFTVKLYRGFTHDRRPQAEDVSAFKDALSPLVATGQLGALLFQFPWSFKNEPESVAYLDELLDTFSEYPRVVEVRHASWNSAEFFQHLSHEEIGFCNIDQPLIGKSLTPTTRVTAPVGYVRLHGRNYQEWFREEAGRDARYDYLYTEAELDPWLDKISEVSESASESYVITNNHFHGQAVVNALQIRARIEKRKVLAPQTIRERYPILEDSTEVDRETTPRQGELF